MSGGSENSHQERSVREALARGAIFALIGIFRTFALCCYIFVKGLSQSFHFRFLLSLSFICIFHM